MRTGLIGQKIGMTRILTEKGQHIPCTLISVDGCQVVSVKAMDKDGYNAVQLGYGSVKTKNVTKPMKGHFAKNRVEPRRKLVEFRVAEDAMLTAGDKLAASHFVMGQYVDVAGTSVGKGFAGVMKRHNFGGLRASHGVSVSHRSHGSTGQRQDPGKVFKGKKMAGHMGSVRVTKQNLEIVHIDDEKGLIAVRGSIPGSAGTFIEITDAVKIKHGTLPYPAGLLGAKAAETEATSSVEAQDAPMADVQETQVVDTPVVEAAVETQAEVSPEETVLQDTPAETPADENSKVE